MVKLFQNGGRLKFVSDFYEAVDNYPHALEIVPKHCKSQKMYDKAVDTYPSTIQFVPEYFMTQKMCGKAVNRCFFIFDSIPDR